MPFVSLMVLFSINTIRFSTRYFLEGLLYEPLHMDIKDILNTPPSSQSEPSRQPNLVTRYNPPLQPKLPVQSNPPSQSKLPVQSYRPIQPKSALLPNPFLLPKSSIQSKAHSELPSLVNPLDNSFSIIDGKYVINDPTKIGVRGFINPATGLPYAIC